MKSNNLRRSDTECLHYLQSPGEGNGIISKKTYLFQVSLIADSKPAFFRRLSIMMLRGLTTGKRHVKILFQLLQFLQIIILQVLMQGVKHGIYFF